MDVNTRQTSAVTLARFRGNAGVRSALIATLQNDPAVNVRQSAARAMSRMGAKAKRALARAATCDPDNTIRAGLAAYGRRTKVKCHEVPRPADTSLPLPRAEQQLLPYVGHPGAATRLAAARDLARMHSARGHQLIWAMSSKDPVWSIRASCLRILARVYKKKILSVLKFTLTQDPDSRVREIAIEALAFLKAPVAVTWLANSAKFESQIKTQVAAVKALRHIGGKSAALALANICESHDREEARAAAVTALHSLKRHRKLGRPVLARVLRQDRSGKVRAAALRALSNDRSATACAARAERINDPDAEVRQTVVAQLAKCPAKISRPALSSVARDDKEAKVRKAAVELLIKAGIKKALPALAVVLQKDKDALIRQRVLESVLTLPKKLRGGHLGESARSDPDPDLRTLAVQGLAKLPASLAVTPLVAVLSRDQVAEVRLEAARALGKYKDAEAYKALQNAAATDSSTAVRQIAAKGASKSPAQKAWVDALLPQTIDSNANIRLKAVTKLCALQIPRTYRALVRSLWMDGNASVRTAIARCFADIDHPLVDIGLSVSHSTDTDGGLIRTVELSQKTRMQRLVKILEETTSDKLEVRVKAIKKLRPSPNPQVRARLEKLLKKDASHKVRKAAGAALAGYLDRRVMQKLMQASQRESDSKTKRLLTRKYNKVRVRWSGGRKALGIGALITALRSQNRRAGIRAARSLGTLRDRRAFQPLKDAAKSKDPAMRYAAVVALATFGDVTIVSKAARTEKNKAVQKQLVQLNFLRRAKSEKVVASMSAADITEIHRAIETAGIKQLNKTVPWLVRLALSHVSTGVRRAAVRTLVLYDHPLARWAIRIAAAHDASKKLRKAMWPWAVFTDTGD